MSEFDGLRRKLERTEALLDGSAMRAALTSKVGPGAKADIRAEAAIVLGPDRKPSGWPRAGALDGGYDVTSNTTLTVKPRPYGVAVVFEDGRKGGTAPKRRKSITMATPYGPRTFLKAEPMQLGRTHGHRVLTLSRERMDRETPGRLWEAMQSRLREVWA